MATEGNASSILAKLMGIDKRLPPCKTRGRRRVLSENYLRDVSSVIHLDKSVSNADASVFNMDNDGDHEMVDEAVECSEGASVDDHQISARGNAVSGRNNFRGDTRMISKLNEVTYSPKTPSFEQREGFIQSGPTRSHCLFNHLAFQSSSCVSVAETHKSSESHFKQPRSCLNINTGMSPGSGSTNKRQKTVSFARNTGLGRPERRKSRLRNNGMESRVRGNVSFNEISKQITDQVNHSVWHSCIRVSNSEGILDKSDADECGKMSPSAKHLMDSENKCEALSSDSSNRSDSGNPLKTKKTHLESRRVSKYFPKWRTYSGSKSEDQINFVGISRRDNNPYTEDLDLRTLVSSNVHRCRVASARFLSAPTMFPSAWVPRTKERRFNLDRNWCSRSGDRDGSLLTESPVDNLGVDKRSVLNTDSAKLKEESILAVFSDAESQTCHKVCGILNVKGDSRFSQGIPVVAICSICDEKMKMCSKLQGEQLPVKMSKTDLCDDAAPCQNDFVLKHERKNVPSPPRSPVSSLEGPEACGHHLNVTLNSKETFVPQCLDDNSLGLQRKLHLLEAVSIESGSEGPGMAVSCDVSDEDGSPCCYREDLQISQCTPESYHFSYLVDVLTESGLITGNLEMENERRFADRYLLDPSVFNILEKKYGKSTARQRSERRLLFDRINSGLVEILRPFVGLHSWRKPVVKRLSVRQSWEFIEEDLWSLLVNQEEESKNNEIEWFDFEEDAKVIVQEIQSLVIDELVEEFLIEEMFCQ
ncbi:hypothetical protein vseg_002831 [Gypsophila vaccaria]